MDDFICVFDLFDPAGSPYTYYNGQTVHLVATHRVRSKNQLAVACRTGRYVVRGMRVQNEERGAGA